MLFLDELVFINIILNLFKSFFKVFLRIFKLLVIGLKMVILKLYWERSLLKIIELNLISCLIFLILLISLFLVGIKVIFGIL